MEVKIYYAGKDFDYVKKYGPVTRGTMIINGKKRFDTLSKNDGGRRDCIVNRM